MTFTDLVVRVLLKATLYAGLAPLAVVLDMHYDATTQAEVCMSTGVAPGRWDCVQQRRLPPSEVDTLWRIGSTVNNHLRNATQW